MRYNIKGKNIDIGERTREKVSAKLDRIEKLFPADAEAVVTFESQKLETIVEVTIPMGKRIIRAESGDADMMAAVDSVGDILEGQIVKYKKRLRSKMKRDASFKAEYEAVPVSEDVLDESPLYKIEKVKHFELRPMDAEEAVMQMELIGHSFFVFRNGETDDVNVVYRRKDGSYGLIEPEY